MKLLNKNRISGSTPFLHGGKGGDKVASVIYLMKRRQGNG
jgi:hypothetical protein